MTVPDDVGAYNRELIRKFRESRGAAMGDRPLLLLTTVGARSGQARTSPMMYIPDGDRLLVVPSNAGAPRHPAWYHNLVANPRVTVEVGSETYEADAVVAEGEERDALFARIAEQYPFFTDHQAKTTRVIPVVALVRSSDSPG
ncbi:nitroreductase family deazaflavin-dependent oxidoreductase [Cryptosporangium aurantiacum]|uniref:Deazaflavin-dependent oxidoreductase, nitroreductase family n=1 Tax=Cryptosporangium aurantiacum TaxID=134849 RepID=A0A1M7RMP1_9ACTN|nr:nitroreductase family deazaflavin-dependent oxidoreductase [Cryptosporangium aurantiacum]SHN47450.1 deazaflavin-dependent oxidoreductase, nitroreductase family [Cryptosporangium aurantiacum]